MKHFGTDGIRALGMVFNLEYLEKISGGIVALNNCKKIIIGRDTRVSGKAIEQKMAELLSAKGVAVVIAGIVPTPTLAYLTQFLNCDYGIMLSASHNPPEYNGLKFINPDGSAFDGAQQSQLEAMITADEKTGFDWKAMKNCRRSDEAVGTHIERITSLIPGQFPLKVALDCGGGAASVITPLLLRKMGCEVIELHCTPDGRFPRPSEPTEKNLQGLVKLTGETGADIGIAHDGDADRMMAVDDKGRFIPGDKLLVIFARYYGGEKVVTTLDASMIIDETGFSVVRTKIGDNYVSEELRSGGRFGGEPSGSWVFPEDTFCPDGPFAAARLISIAAERKLSEYADEIPDYPIRRTSLPMTAFDTATMKRYLQALQPLRVDDRDGIKAGFEDGWIMIRPSGTEPILRLTAEARNEKLLAQLYENGKEIIERYSKDI